MKAVIFRKHGDESVLELAEVPDPAVGARDVRVKVHAVALNHLDLWVRMGHPGLKVQLPHITGADVAGTVESVGAEVKDLQAGAEVVINPGVSCGACEKCLSGQDALCRDYQILGEDRPGGYAELVTVPRQNILPKPKRLTMAEAACLPLTFLTSWTMLMRRAQVRPGETVLVHAAGSGVGSAAVQIAKLAGATVIATASTAEKLDHARALGADHLINYAQQDFLGEVKKITNRKMVDVVFEHVGATTWDKSVASLVWGGRLVTCGATSGFEVKIDLRALFRKQLSLLGSTMGSKGDLFQVLRLVEEGKLRPVLDRTMPLGQAADAHRLVAGRGQFGNVVLVP